MGSAAMDGRRASGASGWASAAALFCLYIVWGSTYLGIKWAVEGFPPMFVAAVRALVAGALIYGVARARGAARPTPKQWRAAAIIGGMLLLGGNGLVETALQWVTSSVCALMVAFLPVWMVVLDRANPARRAAATWVGVALGIAGVTLLVAPRLMALIAHSEGAGTTAAAGHSPALQALGMAMLVCSS